MGAENTQIWRSDPRETVLSKTQYVPRIYRTIRLRLEVFRVCYLSPAGARGKILSSAVYKLNNCDETDFTNQCKASFIFGVILSSILCLIRNQRSLYASSSLKHAMTGLLWGAKASFSRIKTNLVAAKNTHESGNIKTLTHNALIRLYNHTLASSMPPRKNTAYADALTTRLYLSQKMLKTHSRQTQPLWYFVV